MKTCKQFQELIDKGLIGKLFFNPENIMGVSDMIGMGLITLPGMLQWVKNWWHNQSEYFILNQCKLDDNSYILK